jgi:hypothetical protein
MITHVMVKFGNHISYSNNYIYFPIFHIDTSLILVHANSILYIALAWNG